MSKKLSYKKAKAYKKYVMELSNDINEEFTEYITKNNLKFKEQQKVHAKEIEEVIDVDPMVEKMYKKLALKLHPDKNKEDTTEKFQKLSKLYRERDSDGIYEMIHEEKMEHILNDIIEDTNDNKEEATYDILIRSCDKYIKQETEKLHWKWYHSPPEEKEKLIKFFFE